MELHEFIRKYGTEEACREAFRKARERHGVVCRKCQGKEHYWLSTVEQFKCKKCETRTTLRSGTALQASKLPFTYWFTAMFMMVFTKHSISALALQNILGHKRYEPIWLMMHKIRMVMGNQDRPIPLRGELELDDAFFEVGDPRPDDQELKRGRGSQRQAQVLVMAESSPTKGPPKKHRKSRACGRFKMQMITESNSNWINYEVRRHVDHQSKIISDKYSGNMKLKEVVRKHQAFVVPKEEAGKVLPWVHTAIANSKRVFLDAYHRINSDYLQNYLDEFCYRLNRRYMKRNEILESLVIAATSGAWFM